jgi:hypothetical protein
MDASSQTRKGVSSQESLDDKNDICLRCLFKIPPLAPRPAGGTHTFSAAILPMPVTQFGRTLVSKMDYSLGFRDIRY